MKCPECGHTQSYSSGGMRCLSCAYSYVFNPKELPFTSDSGFKHAIDNLSQNGTRYFTFNQLLSYFTRRPKGNRRKTTFGCGVWVAIICMFFGSEIAEVLDLAHRGIEGIPYYLILYGLVPLCIIVLFGVIALLVPKGYPVADRQGLRKAINAWRDSGKELPNYIEQPMLKNPPPDWNEPDIYSYGVERILLVDDPLLVDLFVLNGFHAENHCLVYSWTDRYPSYIADLAEKMATENRELPVFLLHSVGKSRSTVKSEATSCAPFINDGRLVIDLGLHGDTVINTRYMNGISAYSPDDMTPDFTSYMMLTGLLAIGFREQVDFLGAEQMRVSTMHDTSYG